MFAKDTNNNYFASCHRHRHCHDQDLASCHRHHHDQDFVAPYQIMLPCLKSIVGGYSRELGNNTSSPYVLTYNQQYRLSSFATNEIQAPPKISNVYSQDKVKRATQISPDLLTADQCWPCADLLRNDLYNIKFHHYNGSTVIVRKPKPECGRFKFRCEHRIDQNRQQQPTPSDVSSRYRPAHPIFYRNISGQAWLNSSRKAGFPALRKNVHSMYA